MSGREKIWYAGKVIWVTLPDDEPDPDEEAPDLWDALVERLATLTPKQRFVIDLRYGLRPGMDGEYLELGEIADLLGVSKQAVKQIESRAIKRMRRLTGA